MSATSPIFLQMDIVYGIAEKIGEWQQELLKRYPKIGPGCEHPEGFW